MNRQAALNGRVRLIVRVSGVVLLFGCAEEPPPPSVEQFLDNRILLEAAMLRCAENRAELKYEPECVNAREAVNRIAAEEAAERRKELEAQSERKRQALRRAQEAAAEARRRAAEAERLRREAELFGQLPPPGSDSDEAGRAALPTAQDSGNGETGSPEQSVAPGNRSETASPQAIESEPDTQQPEQGVTDDGNDDS